MRIAAATTMMYLLAAGYVVAEDTASLEMPASWLQKAVAYAKEVPDPTLRSDIYYSLVSPLAETQQWGEASRLANLVKNPQTNVYAHTRIATLAQQAGNMTLCRQELSAAGTTAIESQNLSAVIDIITKAFTLGQEDEARRVPAAIKDLRVREVAFQQLADELASRGRLDEALKIGAQEFPSAQDRFHGRLANAIGTALRVDDAERVLAKVSDSRWSDAARRNLAESLARAGRMDEARRQAVKIVATPLREQVLSRFAQLANLTLTVPELQKEFDAATTRPSKLALGERLFVELLKEQRPADAEALIPKLVEAVLSSPREPERSKFGNVDDDTIVLMHQCKALQLAPVWKKLGNDANARRSLAEGRRAYEKLPEESGLAKIFLTETLLAAHLQLGDFEGLEKSVELPANEVFRSKQLSAIAVHQIHSGDVPAGLKTAGRIRGTHIRGRELGQVFVALIDSPMPEQAVKYLQQIGNGFDEADAFDVASSAMLERNKAVDLASMVERIPSAATRAQLCLGAARHFVQKAAHADKK